MSDLVSLDAARFALRVGSEVRDDNLAELLDTAQQALEDWLGYPIIAAEDSENGWPDGSSVPPTIPAAINLIALDLYDNRNTPLQDMTSVRALVGRFQRVDFG